MLLSTTLSCRKPYTYYVCISTTLPSHPSTVNNNRLAAHVIRSSTRKKDDGALEICWEAPSSSRYPFENLS